MRTLSLAVLSLLSFSSFANDITLGQSVAGKNGEVTQILNINYTIVETGDADRPINWEASIGGISSRQSSDIVLRDADGHYTYTDGKAEYITIGGQARKLLNRSTLEAIVRADYAFRTGGTTEYSGYSLLNGSTYDPHSGLNLSAGANYIAHPRLGIGALVSKNIDSGTTQVRLSVGLRFNGNKR